MGRVPVPTQAGVTRVKIQGLGFKVKVRVGEAGTGNEMLGKDKTLLSSHVSNVASIQHCFRYMNTRGLQNLFTEKLREFGEEFAKPTHCLP